MIRRLFSTLSILVLALVAYLVLWPVPIDPVAWEAPVNEGYTGRSECGQCTRIFPADVAHVNDGFFPSSREIKAYTAVKKSRVKKRKLMVQRRGFVIKEHCVFYTASFGITHLEFIIFLSISQHGFQDLGILFLSRCPRLCTF